jgi:hypothetical protein
MNLRVPWNTGNVLTSWVTNSFSKRILLYGVSLLKVDESQNECIKWRLVQPVYIISETNERTFATFSMGTHTKSCSDNNNFQIRSSQGREYVMTFSPKSWRDTTPQNADNRRQQCFPNLRHLRAPFGISALSTYLLSQLYLNQVTGKRSNHVIIKLQIWTKRNVNLRRRCCSMSKKRFSFFVVCQPAKKILVIYFLPRTPWNRFAYNRWYADHTLGNTAVRCYTALQPRRPTVAMW